MKAIGNDDSNRLEPYLDYLNNKKQLSPHQFERLNLMVQARAWRVETMSRYKIVENLCLAKVAGKSLSKSAAYQLLKDSDHVLGKMDSVMIMAERGILYERLEQSIDKINGDKKTSETEKQLAIAKITKVQLEILGPITNEELDADSLMPPTTIIFKGSNQVLINGQN